MFIVYTFAYYGIYDDTSACYWIQERGNWRKSSWYIIIFQDSVGGRPLHERKLMMINESIMTESLIKTYIILCICTE